MCEKRCAQWVTQVVTPAGNCLLFHLVAISAGVVKSWSELPFDMEMLGSFERSGLQIHLVFDEKVHSLTIVLPPGHGDLPMFLDQLSDSSSVFG